MERPEWEYELRRRFLILILPMAVGILLLTLVWPSDLSSRTQFIAAVVLAGTVLVIGMLVVAVLRHFPSVHAWSHAERRFRRKR